jgi:hypothetical protein
MEEFKGNGAIFSPDRTYRYLLWRVWNESPPIHFIMLNPSTADETKNDPTVERCERRAREWGYGGVIVTNIFAYCSTNPKKLSEVKDPVGPDNDGSILTAATLASCTICGWGEHGKLLNRGREVEELLNDFLTYALKINQEGYPSHPLYLGYELEPIPYPEDKPKWKRPKRKTAFDYGE